MTNYYLEKSSENFYNVRAKRKIVASVRKIDGVWEAIVKGETVAIGPTARDAFSDMMDGKREAAAKAAGYASFHAQIVAYRERRAAEAAELHYLLGDIFADIRAAELAMRAR
ncbi:MAG: hypothetical protein JWN75_1172 [Candidatus Saccharibacteria bacterium]|nr:hypothetical protein [Candidatus Saccharibacteria bacterium]